MDSNAHNFARIEKAIKFLNANANKRPSLEETAAHLSLSPFHFQRLFTEWAGISPKKFLQYITVEELKKELLHTASIQELAERTGLSAQSRVYDLFVNIESVTPQEYKTKGAGIEINYGLHQTPFGNCFIAVTKRGICYMSFSDSPEKEIATVKEHWENASVTEDMKETSRICNELFYNSSVRKSFKLLLKGTRFQIKVWEALLKIPFGTVSSYSLIANEIGSAKAMRAVGSAVAANPVAFLIPCHRVIRNEGIIGNYHWGAERKAAILAWEKSKIFPSGNLE